MMNRKCKNKDSKFETCFRSAQISILALKQSIRQNNRAYYVPMGNSMNKRILVVDNVGAYWKIDHQHKFCVDSEQQNHAINSA